MLVMMDDSPCHEYGAGESGALLWNLRGEPSVMLGEMPAAATARNKCTHGGWRGKLLARSTSHTRAHAHIMLRWRVVF